MSSVTSGPIILVPGGFEVIGYPIGWSEVGTVYEEGPEWGPDTLPKIDFRKKTVLVPGVSIALVLTPTFDEAAGLTLSILDEPPEPLEQKDWLSWSEVSVEFLDGGGEVTISMGMEDVGYGPEINDWRLPSGLWRIRGSIFFDKSKQLSNVVGCNHVDSVSILDYPDSGRTWDSLPCQIHLEFWREDEPREPIHYRYEPEGNRHA